MKNGDEKTVSVPVLFTSLFSLFTLEEAQCPCNDTNDNEHSYTFNPLRERNLMQAQWVMGTETIKNDWFHRPALIPPLLKVESLRSCPASFIANNPSNLSWRETLRIVTTAWNSQIYLGSRSNRKQKRLGILSASNLHHIGTLIVIPILEAMSRFFPRCRSNITLRVCFRY